MKLTFDKWHAWRRCQDGASAGLRIDRPDGDPKLSREIVEELRSGRSRTLGRIVSDRKRALEWIGQSQMGFPGRPSEVPAPDPPDGVEAARFGKDGLGLYAEVAGAVIRERLVHLRRTSGLFEILLFDPSPEPPSLYRKAGIVIRAEWLAGLFQLVTGQAAAPRLLAPGYRKEELLTLPNPAGFEGQIRLFMLSRSVGATRTPGAHCNQRRRLEGRKYAWNCPLRQEGKCTAYR